MEKEGKNMKFGLSEETYEEMLEKRKKVLAKATERLKEALNEKETEIAIDGTLHRFEFTFELAWKTMKDLMEYNGIIETTGSPREVLRTAFQSGLIEDGETWIDMMLDRNKLSHLYDEETSRKIYKDIKEKYIVLIEKLNKELEKQI